jgi:sugar phosphate isomerase/epimerase
MKISCTPVSMARSFKEEVMDLESYLNFIAEQELEATDLLDSLCYPWQYKDKKREFKQIPKWLRKTGLKLAALACGNNFAKSCREEFDENIEKVKNSIREAAELGAPLVRIFGGYHEDCGGEKGMDYNKGFVSVIQGIERCLPEAEKYNIVLALENHGRLPGLSWEIKAILEYFRTPFLRCTFDCANFLANNMNETESPLNAYKLLKNDIVHCHLKDWGKPFGKLKGRKVAAYPAGAGGIVPLQQFAALLELNHYEGFCSLEYEAAWQIPELDGVRESLKYLRQIRSTLKILNCSENKNA